jgi:hypothetical protein
MQRLRSDRLTTPDTHLLVAGLGAQADAVDEGAELLVGDLPVPCAVLPALSKNK